MNVTEPAIRARGLGKRYLLGEMTSGGGLLSESLRHGLKRIWNRTSLQKTPRAERPRREELWALKDVSFDIARGEVVGFVGRNGAGKSTLLKILSRITEPSEGRAELRGSLGSLLEVGTGFHPELSGRENIFLNGSILGMPRAEIQRNFDAIVDFSEIGKFLDTPVKRYSSGMYVRLAFSVAAHLRPQILLVDEVLAVGDMGFREKCFRFLNGLRESGVTIIVVTHDLSQLSLLTSRCLWLDQGHLKLDGKTEEVVSAYSNAIHAVGAGEESSGTQDVAGGMELISVRTVGTDGLYRDEIPLGEDLRFEFKVRTRSPVSRPRFGIALHTSDGVKLWMHNTIMGEVESPPLVDRDGTVMVTLKSPPLLAGNYTVWAGISSGDSNSANVASWPDCHRLTITVPPVPNANFMVYMNSLNGTGVFRWPAQWDLSWKAEAE